MDRNNKPNSLVFMKSTLSRLPLYYYYVEQKQREGVEYISSSALADSLSFNHVQVRKDLASISSVPGRSKVGFQTDILLQDMRLHLGYDVLEEAVIVGVGGLGRTLMSYCGFSEFGLSIVAGFDINTALHGTSVASRPVYPMEALNDFVHHHQIRLGIVTVPAPQAQQAADMLVDAGIKAIWNFAPTLIHIPEGIIIKNENLAVSLAVLSKRLQEENGE